jgi:hypothetical protein
MFAVRTVALLAVALAGCFRPTFNDVDCGPQGECPPGLQCDTDGACKDPDDLSSRIDASMTESAPDARFDAALDRCDPIEQTGCELTQKCTYIVTAVAENEPTEGRTDCAMQGELTAGMPCGFTMLEGERVDLDCERGLLCSALNDGVCRSICHPIAAAECEGGACVEHPGFFADLADHGLCAE